jgi:hypothetical protein
MADMAEKTAPVDAGTLLAALAEFWDGLKPGLPPAPDMSMLTAAQQASVRTAELGSYITAMREYHQSAPGRIAGGPFDQPIPVGIRNPYWEIVRQIPLDSFRSEFGGRPEPDAYYFDLRDPMRLMTDRFSLCGAFSWSIPSPGDIAWITERLGGRGIVEPGAGGGYWAWQLAQAGVNVVAYEPEHPDDNKFVSGEPWYPVLRGDHGETAHHPDRSMLLCWPSYGQPWAAWSLAAYRGDQLFYVGEGEGGCCADDEFFSLLGAEWEEAGDCPAHVSYSGIHCYLTEYRRKS